MKNLKFIVIPIVIILIASTTAYMPWLKRIGNQATGFGRTLMFNGATYATSNDTITVSGLGADNLGNHTATTNINMATFAINNASRVSADSCDILNPGFQNTPTFNYQDYTTTGTLNRELAHYWDGTNDDTLTTNTVLPDESLFFVKNKDASFLVTVAAGSGHTLSGDGRIYPGEGVWFQRHGTVIERITPFRRDYRGDLSPTTDSNGDFTVTHNLGTTNVVYFFTPVCDACRYSFRRKTTSGITSNTIVIRVYDESTGNPLTSTSLSVSAMVQRI